MLQIFCKNNKISKEFDYGATLLQIYEEMKPGLAHKPLCAMANNRLEGLTFRVFSAKQVEFLDIRSEAGRKVYMRSMMFVLLKAIRDLCPDVRLTIEAPVSRGYFFTLGEQEATDEMAAALKRRMAEIIAEKHRFHRYEAPTEEVARLFRANGMDDKAKLIEGTGRLYSYYYRLCDTIDDFYGPVVPSTDFLDAFDLTHYYEGLLLRIPRENGELPDIIRQDKMLRTFHDDHKLARLIGMTTVGDLNELNRKGHAGAAIKVAEALQEKKISQISDEIAARKDVRVVLVAGPSSSGKTTFSKRLGIQLTACGLLPRLISLDDYFVDREHTPRDEDGQYDYESIHALNLDLFNRQLAQLLRGEEVVLPHYDFATGQSVNSGRRMRLDPHSVLVLEGIHALNPLMAAGIPAEATFKVYVSALTTIKLDRHNYIPTTDNRLIRRIVRDNQFRGTSACATIARWPSVRRGEDKWIFPYQENADTMFNSALIYELAVLRQHALPLLEAVHQNCEEHAMAAALARFLRFFDPIPDAELPPTSLLREFLGGSSFHY